MKKTILSLLFVAGVAATTAKAQTKIPPDIEKLLQKNTCLACHKADTKLVGPAYKEVMQKKKYKAEQIVELIYKPKPSNWPGYPAMAALPQVPKDEAKKIADWIVTLK
ncbi:MAG: c-type cytochrome [Spirosomaceae bacterium]|jgi:cytochrome c|nr:c-type cytochrome [Spirosomataceae bacterium]